MQFPHVVAVAPNNSPKYDKWQHLAANQAIFKIWEDKTQDAWETSRVGPQVKIRSKTW